MGVHKKGGYIGGFDQLRAPDAPTISVTAGNEQVEVAITDPSDTGGGDVTTYNATASFAVGSTAFDGTGDYIQLPNSSDWDFGTGDFTIETFVYFDDTSSNSSRGAFWQLSTTNSGLQNNSTGNLAVGVYKSSGTGHWYMYAGDTSHDSGVDFTEGQWIHVAQVRSSGTTKLYIDGTEVDTLSDSVDYDGTYGIIGGYYSSSYLLDDAHLSNVRVLKGTALYTSAFTPPTSPLEEITNTKLLMCTNSSGSIVDMSSNKHSLTINGNPTSSTDHPFGSNTPYLTTGATGSSSPVTITGLINNASYSVVGSVGNAYGVSPISAATSSTPSVVGFVVGGWNSYKTVHKFDMGSQANTVDFGDAVAANIFLASAFGSSTRIVAHLGQLNDATIEYWAVASGGNATDFGDVTVNRYGGAGTSSSTRGLISGGFNAYLNATNIIDYVTIASAGNATDFGDLTVGYYRTTGGQSTTRSYTACSEGPVTDTINYVTIASTGNATDFGDATAAKSMPFTGQSNSTRGIIAGGYTSTEINVIEYITIASTGNGTDFGDLAAAHDQGGASTSPIRWFGFEFDQSGLQDIQYVTIASTGNSQDWGDLSSTDLAESTCGTSSAHGGIS